MMNRKQGELEKMEPHHEEEMIAEILKVEGTVLFLTVSRHFYVRSGAREQIVLSNRWHSMLRRELTNVND